MVGGLGLDVYRHFFHTETFEDSHSVASSESEVIERSLESFQTSSTWNLSSFNFNDAHFPPTIYLGYIHIKIHRIYLCFTLIHSSFSFDTISQ